ncbi:protein DpdE [Polyangium sp. 6x1]|uniref:protein DpdE n=1 Tax=Polyangium sp. 6x1 TaxID=3042689 RepID=UPI0024831FF5|nr:protein DpdE [Polyangium sp. 6x1]MDI1450816.1 protein DpdE [Polyangium sp. 6x1]
MGIRQASAARSTTPALGGYGRIVDPDGGVTIGKIRARTDAGVTLEIFRSLMTPEFETVTLAADRVELFDLPRQTLVYHQRGAHWVMGRTVTEEGHGYFAVKFPNENEPVVVSKSELFVRSPRLPDDPTSLLAAQVTSAPHFAEARHRFTGFVSAQRAIYRGLTALASARIELYAHQIAAVRRVLSDPVHRYLLADEVGLGKTMEAGLLIAQHLIDEGERASVLLLVPDALVEQWREELARSFGLKDDPRIHVVPFSALESADCARLSSSAPTLAVIDEAHRMALWAFAHESGSSERSSPGADPRYRAVEELAGCPKLLLLSGTPVLHHEDGFLAMLHLLEPDAYDVVDRKGFRKRVAARKVVADALAELTPDFQPDFLSEALERLSREIDFDDQLGLRVAAVTSALASDPSTAVPAVEELRSYLLERYRLHRRIIRTHRESKLVAHLLPKRCGIRYFGPAEDSARLRAFEALEGWRKRAVEGQFDDTRGGSVVFGHLLSRAQSHPREFARAFDRRATEIIEGEAKEYFDGEASWLQSVAREVHRDDEVDVRATALVEQLRGPLAKRRAVIFVDAPDAADAVVEQLQGDGELRRRVLRFVPGQSGVLTQYEEKSNAILVCDRDAEEGLNLQRKPASIIFYDLPFDVGRIEQRIGRFDRLEGMRELKFLVATPIGPYEGGWTQLLADQVAIFDRSVARLQYVLAEALERLRRELLEAGAEEAFEAARARFADPKTGLEASLKQLRRQEMLDTTDWADDDLQAFCEAVSKARAASSDDARAAIGGWLERMQFEVENVAERGTSYIHVRRERGKNTLVPLQSADEPLLRWSNKEMSRRTRDAMRAAFGPFAFDPNDDAPYASLLAIGHPFFDAIFARMKVDDRSRSWGIWRCYPGASTPEVYVCFDFSIEASLARLTPMARTWKTLASLRRRADEVLPVEHRRTWVDLDGSPVVDAAILKVLTRPYDSETSRFSGDQNLNRDRWALANQQLPVADWGARIASLREELEERVRAEANLQRLCKAAEERIRRATQQAVRILRSRAAHAPAREKQAIEAAIRLELSLGEAFQLGVREPEFCVDNAGVIILAPGPLG